MLETSWKSEASMPGKISARYEVIRLVGFATCVAK
jgi:hypothetical protein